MLGAADHGQLPRPKQKYKGQSRVYCTGMAEEILRGIDQILEGRWGGIKVEGYHTVSKKKPGKDVQMQMGTTVQVYNNPRLTAVVKLNTDRAMGRRGLLVRKEVVQNDPRCAEGREHQTPI